MCLVNGNLAKCNNDKTCIHDGHVYQNNTVWSPVPCSYCKCESEKVNCYVVQCPILECPNVSYIFSL